MNQQEPGLEDIEQAATLNVKHCRRVLLYKTRVTQKMKQQYNNVYECNIEN